MGFSTRSAILWRGHVLFAALCNLHRMCSLNNDDDINCRPVLTILSITFFSLATKCQLEFSAAALL
jgi:hypothetical protein